MADADDEVEDVEVEAPKEGPKGLEEPEVVTKYKTGGEMASRILQQVEAACKVGAKTIDVCKLGDALILAEVEKVYKGKKDEEGNPLKKGIAFPTCVSVNNCVCHNSPIDSDKEIIIAEGDLIKLDLAVHLDGFIAPVAKTFVVGGGEITGRKADVMAAANLAAEVALRMCRPGNKTYAITAAIDKIAKAFNCTAFEGMLSHQLVKDKIDGGDKTIIQAPNPEQKKSHGDKEIAVNEVYAIDILISSGEGKPKEGPDVRTTVYKKTDLIYQLKMKSSRAFFSEMNKEHGSMPFSLRSFKDEKQARLGVTECVNREVVYAFKVLWE